MADPWDDDDIIDFHNSLIDMAPDAWDGDEGQPAIIKGWVDHLVDEVKKRGGCLLPWCHHEDGEPCDHGYLPHPVAVMKVSDVEGRVHFIPLPAIPSEMLGRERSVSE